MRGRPEPMETRIARRLEQDGECIVWTGAKRPNGYGVIGGSVKGVMYFDLPHRVTYRMVKGVLSANEQIDHLCMNRACVNPDHLEAVTQAENVRRENRLRWHGIAMPVPKSVMTVRDFVALLGGAS